MVAFTLLPSSKDLQIDSKLPHQWHRLIGYETDPETHERGSVIDREQADGNYTTNDGESNQDNFSSQE